MKFIILVKTLIYLTLGINYKCLPYQANYLICSNKAVFSGGI